MSSLALYVLISFTRFDRSASWSYGPMMTQAQCESLRVQVAAEYKEGGWGGYSEVVTPKVLKCVKLPPPEAVSTDPSVIVIEGKKYRLVEDQ